MYPFPFISCLWTRFPSLLCCRTVWLMDWRYLMMEYNVVSGCSAARCWQYLEEKNTDNGVRLKTKTLTSSEFAVTVDSWQNPKPWDTKRLLYCQFATSAEHAKKQNTVCRSPFFKRTSFKYPPPPKKKIPLCKWLRVQRDSQVQKWCTECGYNDQHSKHECILVLRLILVPCALPSF